MMAEKTYSLYIYEEKECLVAFDSDTPFGAIAKGDIIDPQPWELKGMYPDVTYEVIEIKHQIWSISHLRHNIFVYVKGKRNL